MIVSGILISDSPSAPGSFTIMASGNSDSEIPSIGLLTVALGELYVNYWKSLVSSFLSVSGAAESCVTHVFTDRPDLISSWAESNQPERFRIHEVDSRPWPFATLDRFEIFDAHLSSLSEDLLIYLDADMQILAPLPPEVFQGVIKNGIYFVEHPGYTRPRNVLQKLALYSADWRLFLSDLKTFLQHGALGEWENSRESSSFTPRGKRKRYVCGGCWMARKEKAHYLIRTISAKTRADKEKGVIARWHDESHLNFFQSEHGFPTLSPAWCFVEGYRHLSGQEPIILAVEKGDLRAK